MNDSNQYKNSVIKDNCHFEEITPRNSNKKLNSRAAKSQQIQTTIEWIDKNYEEAKGVCLPRCALYQHYLDFCCKQRFSPTGAAAFGKVIRRKFPNLTTKRLGTRGQSKYHYYGIGVKANSVYYKQLNTGAGLTRFSGFRMKTTNGHHKKAEIYSPNKKTVLQEFPSFEDYNVPSELSRTKVRSFFIMYKIHCRRILDHVINSSFEEIKDILFHFWNGMPDHLKDLMHSEFIADVIEYSDFVLYEAFEDKLLPATLENVAESFLSEISNFLHQFPSWMDEAMRHVPDLLKDKKQQVLQVCLRSVKRSLAFLSLIQDCRVILANHQTMQQIIDDVSEMDVTGLVVQMNYLSWSESSEPFYAENVQQYLLDIVNIIGKQPAIEEITEWMDRIIEINLLQEKPENFVTSSSQFLLHLGFALSMLMRDLTLRKAKSFGSCQVLSFALQEYATVAIATEEKRLHKVRQCKILNKWRKNSVEAKRIPRNEYLNSSDLGVKNPTELNQNNFLSTEHHYSTYSNCAFPSNEIEQFSFNFPNDNAACTFTGNYGNQSHDFMQLEASLPRLSENNQGFDVCTVEFPLIESFTYSFPEIQFSKRIHRNEYLNSSDIGVKNPTELNQNNFLSTEHHYSTYSNCAFPSNEIEQFSFNFPNDNATCSSLVTMATSHMILCS